MIKCIKFLFRIFLILFFVAALWLAGFVYFVARLPEENKDKNFKSDGIVVLTGGSQRLNTAVWLLAEKRAKRLLITGVGKGADLNSMLILSGGPLPDNISEIIDLIDLGYEAKDTKGNAVEAANWVKQNNYKSIFLVTSFYHIPRSLNEFDHMIPDVDIYIHAVLPQQVDVKNWWRDVNVFKLLTSEYHKYLASLIRIV